MKETKKDMHDQQFSEALGIVPLEEDTKHTFEQLKEFNIKY